MSKRGSNRKWVTLLDEADVGCLIKRYVAEDVATSADR